MNEKYKLKTEISEVVHNLPGLGLILYEYKRDIKELKIFVNYKYYSNENRPVRTMTGDDAKSMFLSISSENLDRKALSLESIENAIYNLTGWDFEALKVKLKTQELCFARQLCMYAIYVTNNDKSLSDIGKLFGKDHATVLHAKRLIESENKYLKSFQVEMKTNFFKILNIKSKTNE